MYSAQFNICSKGRVGVKFPTPVWYSARNLIKMMSLLVPYVFLFRLFWFHFHRSLQPAGFQNGRTVFCRSTVSPCRLNMGPQRCCGVIQWQSCVLRINLPLIFYILKAEHPKYTFNYSFISANITQ